MMSCQKVPEFDFQSQFAMSNIIEIFLNFFFTEEYKFRSTFFDNINFEITLLSKMMPNFWHLPINPILKIQ